MCDYILLCARFQFHADPHKYIHARCVFRVPNITTYGIVSNRERERENESECTINDKNLFLILYFIRCCTLCTLVMPYPFTICTPREREEESAKRDSECEAFVFRYFLFATYTQENEHTKSHDLLDFVCR